MKSIFTRFNLIVGAAALVLLTLCLLQTPARACDHRDGPVISAYSCGYGSIGLVHGQSLRVTLANLIELEGREQNPVEVFARVRLYDAQGRVIAQSAELRIPLNQFRSFYFNRAALPFPGEPGTGRLQMRVGVEVPSTEPYPLVRDARASGLLPTSLEIIDNSTGVTNVSSNTPQGWFSVGPSPSNSANGVSNSGFENDVLIGLVPGQTLRLNIFNSSEKGATSIKAVPVRVTIYDALGNEIETVWGIGYRLRAEQK